MFVEQMVPEENTITTFLVKSIYTLLEVGPVH